MRTSTSWASPGWPRDLNVSNRRMRTRMSGGVGGAARSLSRLGLRITDKLDAKNTKCDSDFVTQATQKLLDEFEALPERDRSELVAELARRVALAPHDLPQDNDFVAAADRLFTELDRRDQLE